MRISQGNDVKYKNLEKVGHPSQFYFYLKLNLKILSCIFVFNPVTSQIDLNFAVATLISRLL